MLTANELNARLPYCFGNEIEWLTDYSKNIKRAIVLGAGPGLMSLALLEGNPNLELHAVDLNQATLATYVAHLKAAGFENFFLYLGLTSEFANRFDDSYFDFIIVDADHSGDAVALDIALWWPKLQSDGSMFFHDYEDLEKNGTNGVKPIVDKLIKDNDLRSVRVGISMVVEK